MKKFQYIALAAVAVAFASCDFFESESPSAMDAATVFSNENSTEQVIAAVYEQFGQDKSYRNRLACGYQGMVNSPDSSAFPNIQPVRPSLSTRY